MYSPTTTTHRAYALLLAIAATTITSALYAATPTAIWDSAATGMGLDTTQGGLTLAVGYKNSIANGKITIGASGVDCSGCSITLPADVREVSLLVKYSNFAKQDEHGTYDPILMSVRDSTNHELGIRSCDNGTGFTNYWYQVGSDGWTDGAKKKASGEAASFSFCDPNGNVSVPSGYALFSYSTTKGLHLSIGKDVKSLSGNTNTTYHFSSGNETVVNIGIGGAKDISFNDGWVGLVIEKVALFTGEFLSPSDVASFEFPVVSASEINARFSAESEISLSLPDGTIVNGDVAFTASKINFSSAGSIAVKPPVGNTTIFDFTDVTGKPIILYEGALPTQSGSTFTATTFPDFVTNSTQWTGTIWLRNIAVTDFNVNPYGNALSTVRLTGISGWLRAPSNSTYANSVPVELSDVGTSNGYALLINNGNSANESNPLRCTAFVKISGDGTIACNTSAYPVIKVYDFSQFTGSLSLNFISLIVCDASTQYTSFYEMFGLSGANASLIIESGKSATIAEGKTWAVKNIKSHGALSASAGTDLGTPASVTIDGSLNFTTSGSDLEEVVLFSNIGTKSTVRFGSQTLSAATINGAPYDKTLYAVKLSGSNLIYKKKTSGFLYYLR